MTARQFLTLFAVFLSSTIAQGGHVPDECKNWPAKSAAEWTMDERIEHRIDRVCMEARRSYAANSRRRDGSCRGSGQKDFVFGTDTPELFTPFELFDHLIAGAFRSESAHEKVGREIFERKAPPLDLPGDFWHTVEVAANDFIELRWRQIELMKSLDRASPTAAREMRGELERLRARSCETRVASLDRARQSLPNGLFDAFLYQAVAPGICMSGSSDATTLRVIGECLQH